MENKLTHFDKEGKAIMVDVSEKEDTSREATAKGKVIMKKETLNLIKNGEMGKGDVLGVARVAGIMAAKQTHNIIPMCHPLMITKSQVDFSIIEEENAIEVIGIVKTTGKTGVEMEALTAVSAAALTIYDMCKAVDKKMTICDVHLYKKTGGKSGNFIHEK
ncbi:cyclic pyranopterin monophosphate synthase MoaC [Anaeromicrobium sediminis]|uniref:Cyclic pyranopterin monophosphate synthase n=1 Tax=Anaeromicrobium sediminis TaxID=1478221 RepID=A0A267MB56_9FIRM|nr:cyclic pyranopterin monophosphate synthase MoaC [Anaeromicrobium sediminis]PAB56811.1 cyclic pyranopterin monophosphate synthase MoaC [Anaeromicrobium sediminis]